MLFALKAELGENTFLKVHLDTLNSANHLGEGLGLNGPGGGRRLQSVQGLRFLLLEEFRLSCHLQIIYL